VTVLRGLERREVTRRLKGRAETVDVADVVFD
jgi:hypothetical protein